MKDTYVVSVTFVTGSQYHEHYVFVTCLSVSCLYPGCGDYCYLGMSIHTSL